MSTKIGNKALHLWSCPKSPIPCLCVITYLAWDHCKHCYIEAIYTLHMNETKFWTTSIQLEGRCYTTVHSHMSSPVLSTKGCRLSYTIPGGSKWENLLVILSLPLILGSPLPRTIVSLSHNVSSLMKEIRHKTSNPECNREFWLHEVKPLHEPPPLHLQPSNPPLDSNTVADMHPIKGFGQPKWKIHTLHFDFRKPLHYVLF